MSCRPVIGFSTQTLEAVPGEWPRAWIMGQRYVKVITAAGGVPWVIPLLGDETDTLRQIYDRLDGVFLPGGVDVDPSYYGEERHERCGRTDPDRDRTEMQLIRWSLEDDKPLLAVCRGIQSVNVAAGGTLYQDLSAQRPEALKHDYFPTAEQSARDRRVHCVRIENGTRLASIVGAGTVEVNSMHHQGIKDLGPGLVASAFAPDGLVEGIEASNGDFLVGVQWHPEELAATDEVMGRLFRAFIEAASARRASA